MHRASIGGSFWFILRNGLVLRCRSSGQMVSLEYLMWAITRRWTPFWAFQLCSLSACSHYFWPCWRTWDFCCCTDTTRRSTSCCCNTNSHAPMLFMRSYWKTMWPWWNWGNTLSCCCVHLCVLACFRSWTVACVASTYCCMININWAICSIPFSVLWYILCALYTRASSSNRLSNSLGMNWSGLRTMAGDRSRSVENAKCMYYR